MQRVRPRLSPMTSSSCDNETLGRLSEHVARLYRIWLALALILLGLGTVLDLAEDGKIATETIPLRDLAVALAHADPAAFESVALLIVAFGPVAGLLAIIVSCFRQGDRRTAALAALVLLVVAALPIARSVGGR